MLQIYSTPIRYGSQGAVLAGAQMPASTQIGSDMLLSKVATCPSTFQEHS